MTGRLNECSHLDGRQKCSNACAPGLEPSHVFRNEHIENPVPSTSRLEFSKSKEEKEVEAICCPIERGDACQHQAISRDIVAKSIAIQLPSSEVCIVAKDETVNDCEDWDGACSNNCAQDGGGEYRQVFFGGERKETHPAHLHEILLIGIAHDRLFLIYRIARSWRQSHLNDAWEGRSG